jgi:hypothetical protein
LRCLVLLRCLDLRLLVNLVLRCCPALARVLLLPLLVFLVGQALLLRRCLVLVSPRLVTTPLWRGFTSSSADTWLSRILSTYSYL